MPKLKLPPKTTEAIGEEAAQEFTQWFTEVLETWREQSVSRDEFRELLTRMDILEHDVAGLKAEVAEFRRETNARFDAVNARFDAMEGRFNARFDAMEERFDARFDRLQSEMNTRIDTIHETMRSQTRWLIATLIALGGLISVLITIFEFIH